MTYIQDKLDDTFRQIGQIGSIHPEIVDEFILLKNQSLTDYHNHIVEKIKEIAYEPNVEPSWHSEELKAFIKSLQDTNPKE